MERRMSRKERDRLTILRPLAEGRLTRVAAGRLLGLSVRQVRRILLRHRAEGDAGLVHRARQRPSNRRMPEATARRAVALVKARYRDFGPTRAAEKLAERDGLAVSREGRRRRMIEAGLWRPRRRRGRHVEPATARAGGARRRNPEGRRIARWPALPTARVIRQVHPPSCTKIAQGARP